MGELDNYQATSEGAPRWMGLAVVALAVLSLAGLGLAWNAGSQAHIAQQALAAQTKTLQQNEDGLTQRIAQAEQTNNQMQGELNLVTDKLKLTQDQLTVARTQVKQTRADYTKKLTDVETTLATKASSDELKRLGERDYFEFNLTAKGQTQHVGSSLIELRGVNSKKHQYTVALTVDDIKHEEKNKGVNEPIYFYSGGSRQASELVVNQVGQNKISGYLSSPKASAQSAKAAATN